jgi:transcriptional antiterminator RfaH
MSVPYFWYAVYTHSRAEKKVYKNLINSGIEVFLPLQKRTRQWSDRKRIVEEPLIRSYIFVRISEKEYYVILNTPGVVRYVTFSGKAAVIPDWQIEILKKTILYNVENKIITEKAHPGDKVEIIGGPFRGYKGHLVDFCGKKMLLIEISHIGHSLLLNIPGDDIKLL